MSRCLLGTAFAFALWLSLPQIATARTDLTLAYYESDGFWYSAEILEESRTGYRVRFLCDATTAEVPMHRVISLDVEKLVEIPLWCNWQGGGTFYPGVIERIRGRKIHFRYDDGDEEDTTIDQLRFSGSVPILYAEGELLLALYTADSLLYPARVAQVDDEALRVVYLDGTEEWLPQFFVVARCFVEGDKVEVYVDSAEEWLPGVVVGRAGEDVVVEVDGEQLETTLESLRANPDDILPQAEEEGSANDSE